jgi:hypothetical protein
MISEAIKKINPNACCVVKNDDIDNIEWINTQPISKELILAEVAKLEEEYNANQYQRDRGKEYPDFKDYLDGIVKGDQAQIDKYIADCLAVKAKYPKE